MVNARVLKIEQCDYEEEGRGVLVEEVYSYIFAMIDEEDHLLLQHLNMKDSKSAGGEIKNNTEAPELGRRGHNYVPERLRMASVVPAEPSVSDEHRSWNRRLSALTPINSHEDSSWPKGRVGQVLGQACPASQDTSAQSRPSM